MKKMIVIILAVVTLLFSSCATILEGNVSSCQKTKPLPGSPSRDIRVGYLILDLFVPVSLIVDFATGAIYKPCK